MQSRQIQYQPDPNKFDLRTHVWDARGHLVSKNLYRSFIVEGTQYFERPVNSGNLWFENNQPAGRVELEFNDKGHIVRKTFRFDEPHKAYKAPLTGAEKLHFELEQARAKNEELLKQIEEMKAGKKEHNDSKVLASVIEGFPSTDETNPEAEQVSTKETKVKNRKGR